MNTHHDYQEPEYTDTDYRLIELSEKLLEESEKDKVKGE